MKPSEARLIQVCYYCFSKNKPYTIEDVVDMFENKRNQFNLLYAMCLVDMEQKKIMLDNILGGRKEDD